MSWIKSWLLPKLESKPVNMNESGASFDVCVGRVLEHEGGYVNHPSDPGGATNYGITQSVARKHGYDGDMRHLSKQKAMDIYRADYWDKSRAGDLPQALAFQYFDACVNHGVSRGVRLLQQAVGAEVDGKIGPKTIEAAWTENTPAGVMRFNQARIAFYTGLKTFSTFGKGWMNRIAKNLEYGAADVG